MTNRKTPPASTKDAITGVRDGEGSDGLLWPEETLSEARRQSLARIDRAAVGILTAVEILHAASRCEGLAKAKRHLDEGVVEGLFFACRELAELVCREVRPG